MGRKISSERREAGSHSNWEKETSTDQGRAGKSEEGFKNRVGCQVGVNEVKT